MRRTRHVFSATQGSHTETAVEFSGVEGGDVSMRAYEAAVENILL